MGKKEADWGIGGSSVTSASSNRPRGSLFASHQGPDSSDVPYPTRLLQVG